MPIYEFLCESCQHEFEQLVFITDSTNPECPNCKNENVKKLMSAASVRPQGIPTGSGGYKGPACKSGAAASG